MQTNVTRNPKVLSKELPSQGLMSTLLSINSAAENFVELSPRGLVRQIRQTEGVEGVRNLLNEALRAESHLKRIREFLEERSAERVVSQQVQEGQREFERLVAKKLLMDSAEFVGAMDWTRQALSKALAANRVFYVQHGRHRYYPKFFSEAQYDRRQIEAVCQTLGELPGASKWQFFSTPKGSLGGKTPLEALKSGKFSMVKAAAEGFLQR